MQSAPCAISPADKKAQAKLVGEDLVRHHGKRKFYSIEQVRESNRRKGITMDVACWSHAMFNSHADFDRLHADAGEACDYASMKAEMLGAVATGEASDWFDWDLSWLEFPELDISIFDFFDL
ncbi:MAG: hypothetical protein H0W24_09045 [Lysobacter sp.]|nr:hypothetical protein [Lysobacter sp.]MDQ3269543.1 hypothetical protein [Pseudomonadota bacterium]